MIRDKTFVYFHTIEPVEVSWIVFNSQGDPVETIYRSQSLASINKKNHDISVFIPAQTVLVTAVEMPS